MTATDHEVSLFFADLNFGKDKQTGSLHMALRADHRWREGDQRLVRYMWFDVHWEVRQWRNVTREFLVRRLMLYVLRCSSEVIPDLLEGGGDGIKSRLTEQIDAWLASHRIGKVEVKDETALD